MTLVKNKPIAWDDTVASDCRYGPTVGRAFNNAAIIWEDSHSDYQGWANVFAATNIGTFIHYEWSYGSCSGCDSWEAADMDDDQILDEVYREMAVLDSKAIAQRYVDAIGGSMKEAFDEFIRRKQCYLE